MPSLLVPCGISSVGIPHPRRDAAQGRNLKRRMRHFAIVAVVALLTENVQSAGRSPLDQAYVRCFQKHFNIGTLEEVQAFHARS